MWKVNGRQDNGRQKLTLPLARWAKKTVIEVGYKYHGMNHHRFKLVQERPQGIQILTWLFLKNCLDLFKVSPHSLALNIWLLDLQLHFLYLCNQCLSPLKWVWIPLRWGVLDTTLCNKVCQWLAAGWWFSVGSSTNPADRHDITEILLKVALNTINQTKPLLQ